MPSRPCAGPAPGVRCTGGRNGSVALVTVRPGSKTAGRCPSCRGSWQRAKDARRPDRRTYAEQQRRRQTVAGWVEVHGYLCPGCPTNGWRPHPADPATNPLTAEHVRSVAETGDEHGPLAVMCQRGNSTLGARLRRER